MKTNLNIEAEYFRCTNPVNASTVEDAEKAIDFCAKYGSEIIFLHKDGVVTQYMKFQPKGIN